MLQSPRLAPPPALLGPALLSLLFAACAGAEDGGPIPSPAQTATAPADPGPAPPPAATTAPPATKPPTEDPGTPPAGCADLKKDKDGFFTRSQGQASYVGFVPKGYAGTPTRLVVGLHGCGDSAANFASWAINPYATRATQDWIGISVDGASAGGKCWSVPGDAPKIAAAIADVSTCFFVHKQRVVLAGYSSGGILAYQEGLSSADKYAGILVLNAGLYATGKADALLAGAARKLPIAHRAHQGDTTFPLSKVQPDWDKIKQAGFPITTSTGPGGHDATGDDFSKVLLPASASWTIQ